MGSCQIIDQIFAKKGTFLADVSGEKLKKTEAEKYLPPYSSREDSTLKAETLVNDWIIDQLIIAEAKKDKSIDFDYIEDKVNRLKENLIIHEYCQNYINNHLDTALTQKELETYYLKNQANFILKEKIVKGYFIKIENTSPLLKQMRKEFDENKIGSAEELKKMSQSQAKDYYFTDNEWIELSKFIIQAPAFQKESERNILIQEKERVIETNDFVYFLRLTDIVLEGETAPFDLKAEMIGHIILNNKKQELIKKLRKSIFSNATKNNAYHIY